VNVLEFLDNPSTDVLLTNYFVIDFETTNLEKGSARNLDNSIVLCSIRDNDRVHSEFTNEYNIHRACSLAESKLLVAHNAKFELQWLHRGGCDLTKVVVWDTMLAEYVLYGNLIVPLDLGSVAKRYGLPGKEVYIDKCIKSGICPSTLPKSLLKQRCEYDVWVTEQIFLAQRARLQSEGKLGVMLTRCLLTPVLADIEFNGMCPAPERVIPMYTSVLEEWTECKGKLELLHPGVNWNSPQQIAVLLYDTLSFSELKDHKGVVVRTPASKTFPEGQRKADADTIAKLKAKTKEQKELQQLVLLESKLNTKLKFLSKLKDCCTAEEVLLGNFNQTRTRTHRLSSSGTKYKIQFQNMDREYKKLFRARTTGWLMGEQDGAQLEFRVAAFEGQDAQAILDIRNEEDVHSFTAATITAAGQVTSRQEAKAHTFKPLYGGTSGTKAEQAYYKAFKAKYSGIAQTQQSWIEEVVRNKKLRIPSGLEFFWPKAKMSPDGYVQDTASICNYPVQSFATADIIPIAVVYFWHKIKSLKLKTFIVNTIHDSIISEVHPEEQEIYKQVGIECFTTDVYKYLKKVYNVDFNVPLGVGTKLGEYWSEGTEDKLQVEPICYT